jgi:hypothetical protein
MTSVETELREYFERYAKLFHENLDQFCALYHEPSTTVRLDGSVEQFQTRPLAHEFFASARANYERLGCRSWAIRNFSVQELGTSSAAATLDWEMLTADGALIRGWRQTYNVIRSDESWLVVLSTLHVGTDSLLPVGD